MATRLTREQSKAATRDKLLDAARTVFAARGFHGASVEEIAAAAGYSTGALYSNFGGKEDLFLVLMDRELSRHASELNDAVARRETVSEKALGGADYWMALIERERELLLLFMEFWAYGVRDPNIRPHVAAHFAETRRMLTCLVAESARELGIDLAIPAEHVAIAIDAIADGIMRQKLADPDAIPDDLLGTILSRLFTSAMQPAHTGTHSER